MAKFVCNRRVLLSAAILAALGLGDGMAVAASPASAPVPAGKPALREVRRADGALSHCVVDQAYDGGMHMNLARNRDGRMNLGIVVPGAAYDPGATYAMRLELGAAPMRIVKARAQAATMLLIDLGQDADFAAQLTQAQGLAVVGRVERMEFSVPDAATMLAQLEQCAGGAEGDLALPPALKQLLRAAGLEGSVAVDPGSTPEGRDFADYVWRYNALTGGARQRDLSRAVDFAGIVKTQLAAQKERCRGTWQATLSDLAAVGEARQQRALVACARGRDGAAMGILFHQAADGKFSIISHAGALTDKEQAQAVTAALAEVLAAGAEKGRRE